MSDVVRVQVLMRAGDAGLEDTFALFAVSAFRKGIAKGSGRPPPPVARLEFLRSRMALLQQIVRSIDESPRRFLRAETVALPLRRTRRATATEVIKSFRSGKISQETKRVLPPILKGRVPTMIRQAVRRPSEDIPEHRQIKGALQHWADWLQRTAALLQSLAGNDAEIQARSAHWARRTRAMTAQIRTLLTLPVFQSVPAGPPYIIASAIWQSDPRYRRFANLHRDMMLGLANVFGDFLQMPLARTFDLYELWSYLRLARAAVERYGALPQDVAGLFENSSGSGITIASGSAVVQVPKGGFALMFQRSYREYWLEKDRRGSFSREMRPDIVVESIGDAAQQLVVLDAKYRIGPDLNDALASAHMYRDALVTPSDGSEVRRIVKAAYLLTPDSPAIDTTWEKASMPGRLFHPEYRGLFRFGALTLRPGMSIEDIANALDTVLVDAGIGGASSSSDSK